MTNKNRVSGRGEYTRLISIFCLWKSLLLILAAFCPGPGYDTSAFVLFDARLQRHDGFHDLSHYDRLTLNLFRWDALYFVKAAERNKVHEQEWAFSWAYSHILRLAGQFFSGYLECPLQYYILAGIVLSNVCHLLSVIVLYHLLISILEPPQRRIIPFVAAVLHVLTPASLFMCAPYAEAMFSLLNFTGMLFYARSKGSPGIPEFSISRDLQMIASGFSFGAATLMRSNGLLSGSIFLYDVATYLPRISSAQLSIHDVRRIIVSCLAGSLIALGFVAPQYLAYAEFCNRDSGVETRPWCERGLPSVYSWVQSHYWNVGLFRYWTISNLPLFLVAAPMLWLLFASSVTVLRSCVQRPLHGRPVPQVRGTSGPRNGSLAICALPELALPQLLLAITATTSFHVQIVNRIASGYPIWYLIIAMWMTGRQTSVSTGKYLQRRQWFVRGIVVYALVQGMLYGNFLPPA